MASRYTPGAWCVESDRPRSDTEAERAAGTAVHAGGPRRQRRAQTCGTETPAPSRGAQLPALCEVRWGEAFTAPHDQGTLRILEAALQTAPQIIARFKAAGFGDFRSVVQPEGWQDAFDQRPEHVLLLAADVARFLGCSLATVLGDGPLTVQPSVDARFFRAKKSDPAVLAPSVLLAERVAGAVVRALREPDRPVVLPASAHQWREELLAGMTPEAREKGIGLAALCADVWRRGIPVVFLKKLPVGKPFGMAMLHDGRPVVVLSKASDTQAEQAFILAHEVAHHCLGHVVAGHTVVDGEGNDREEEEQQADAWADVIGVGDHLPNLREAAPARPEAVSEVNPYFAAWIWARRNKTSNPTAFQTAMFRMTQWQDRGFDERDGAGSLLEQALRDAVEPDLVRAPDQRLLGLVMPPTGA